MNAFRIKKSIIFDFATRIRSGQEPFNVRIYIVIPHPRRLYKNEARSLTKVSIEVFIYIWPEDLAVHSADPERERN
jgi:hypothetical protein